MRSTPEVPGNLVVSQARLERPRVSYATPGLGPGRLAPLDGDRSRRSTVMRHCPVGQPAHIRVIRRRSRLLTLDPGDLRCFLASHPYPRGAPPRWARPALGRAGPETREQ
jgi:hypothetical protein